VAPPRADAVVVRSFGQAIKGRASFGRPRRSGEVAGRGQVVTLTATGFLGFFLRRRDIGLRRVSARSKERLSDHEREYTRISRSDRIGCCLRVQVPGDSGYLTAHGFGDTVHLGLGNALPVPKGVISIDAGRGP